MMRVISNEPEMENLLKMTSDLMSKLKNKLMVIIGFCNVA